MDWFGLPIPDLRHETRFGDRLVPAFPDRPHSLWQMLEDAAARRPDGEAVVCGDERLTWREVLAQSARVAAGLATRGLVSGDRVALLLGNRTEFVLALFGAARLGLVSVVLSTRQQTPELAYALSDSGARLIIHEDSLTARLPQADAVPALAHRVAMSDFADLLAATPDGPPAAVDEEDTALILYTSGTTGRPKGAMLAHCNLIHSAMIYEACMALTPADRSIAVVPLAHVTGVVANIMSMARCVGTLIVVAEFKAAEYLRIAAREHATHTVMVPAMYNLCLLQADFANHDLSAWRIGGYGGAPMPTATIEKLAQAIPGLKLINAYGATETTSPSTIMPPQLTASHLDSVGLPCPGAHIIAVDPQGHELPPGEIGELWIHGGSVIKGYWNNPTATAEGFTAGYWHSGDLGSVDERGFVRVFDRAKDMINRGGLKIYSAEVESVLAGHPDVVESAIVAKPCPVLGERVHAIVVTRNTALAADSLRLLCASQLSDYKVPESFDITLEPLPRNANGKVMKKQLRERMAAA
ncbi:MAG: class I adenylate-forming enzyme family protein [Pseudomonadota bacterium]|jgi:acyl-CoA synthetase (AMP-forming)/AMP-acid ligase II